MTTTDPRRSADSNNDAIAKAAWDSTYRLSESANLWGDPPVPFVETALETFGAQGSINILDGPCGDGRNLRSLAAAAAHVTGVDSAPRALRLAAAGLQVSNIHNVLLVEGDLMDLPFCDDQFDGVFCCDVLGHLRAPRAAVNELLRVTRPGHCIVANVFSMGDETRGVDMEPLGSEQYMFADSFFFQFYDKPAVECFLAAIPGARLEMLELVRWKEPPHEGFREYEHEHESWLFTIRKD